MSLVPTVATGDNASTREGLHIYIKNVKFEFMRPHVVGE